MFFLAFELWTFEKRASGSLPVATFKQQTRKCGGNPCKTNYIETRERRSSNVRNKIDKSSNILKDLETDSSSLSLS